MYAAQSFAGTFAQQFLQLHARHQFLHVLAREDNLPLLVQDQNVVQYRVERFDPRLLGRRGGLSPDRLDGCLSAGANWVGKGVVGVGFKCVSKFKPESRLQ